MIIWQKMKSQFFEQNYTILYISGNGSPKWVFRKWRSCPPELVFYHIEKNFSGGFLGHVTATVLSIVVEGSNDMLPVEHLPQILMVVDY